MKQKKEEPKIEGLKFDFLNNTSSILRFLDAHNKTVSTRIHFNLPFTDLFNDEEKLEKDLGERIYNELLKEFCRI